MTNKLEKQFFDTFGIEPMPYCCYHDCNCPINDIGKFNSKCPKQAVTKECDARIMQKPQITDRILLGIIAKIMWSYSCTQNDFDAYEVHTVDNLKEAVLKHAIELSKNDAYVYWGVRTLFEEG